MNSRHLGLTGTLAHLMHLFWYHNSSQFLDAYVSQVTAMSVSLSHLASQISWVSQISQRRPKKDQGETQKRHKRYARETQERHRRDTGDTQERRKRDTRESQERNMRDTRETQERAVCMNWIMFIINIWWNL